MFARILSTLMAFLTAAMFALATPAIAGDAASGAKIFSANCAACHAGGNNVVNGAKTLKKDALEKYEMNSIDAITYQVNNGKNAMPAFKGRLTDAQIDDVATYVLSQSEAGW
ncbi:c-type cytochrome [Waterburya agarophytonicola K14]|uniref:Cytochrome c6 n=1 Tax=Waterburya agarophytonicola KI4 TaxID=2874699 RepID=A0A964BMP4_9CYAN|nr:c-type cytochrome [Waterburya agarophytonicola]MCC0176208.1 c-type cytochrome [Waterburya agarophytonicola KI4]